MHGLKKMLYSLYL